MGSLAWIVFDSWSIGLYEMMRSPFYHPIAIAAVSVALYFYFPILLLAEIGWYLTMRELVLSTRASATSEP